MQIPLAYNLLLSGNMPDKPCIVVNSGNIN
jgi:hypothetical protein